MAYAVLTSTESGAQSLTDINANFALAAPLDSPALTGTPSLPTGTTGVTQSPGNSSTKLATTAFVAAAVPAITIQTTAGSTHSLTTTASQNVIVWAKGTTPAGTGTITLTYGGSTKDTMSYATGAGTCGFALMWVGTPGAGTYDLVVSAGTDVKIVVFKI